MPDKLKDCTSGDRERARTVHRRGRLRRRAGGQGPQPRAPRRSCPSEARSSTSSGPGSTGCCKNAEIQALIAAIGAGLGRGVRHTTSGATTRSCIWPTPTSTASHIRTLLLTFFFRQMRPLVEHGHVYICPAAAVLDRGGQGEGLPEGRPRPRPGSWRSTPTTRRSSSGSRGWARWTGRSSRSRPWTRPAHAAADQRRAGGAGRRGACRS